MKRIFLFVLLAILVVAIPAAASSPQEVEILVRMPPPPGPPGPGTFEASEPAGIVCSSGDANDEEFNVTGWKKGKGIVWHSRRVFTCPDGDTFTIRLNANITFEPYENKGNWNVLSGTGKYEKLHGAGKLTAYWDGPQLVDVFTGKMHID